MGLAGAAILFASTLSFFVPTRYQATFEGLRVERLGLGTLYPWARFRSVERLGRRMWLSTYRAGTFLSRLRSVRVDLPDEGADSVYAYVQSRIARS